MNRKLFITFFFIYFISNLYSQAVKVPVVTARGAILMDRYSGCTLWEKNAELKLPMASTTKIMTAIIIIDKGSDKLSQTVKVSPHAFATGGSSVFAAGDQPTLEELLKAIMLRSSNEAAAAAAEFLGGGGVEGEKQFVKWMNEKAIAMGLKNTHFMNPHGLYDKDHYTTAHDLACLTRYALA
ncbi:MAG: serine hydrolase, partial [bacterium]